MAREPNMHNSDTIWCLTLISVTPHPKPPKRHFWEPETPQGLGGRKPAKGRDTNKPAMLEQPPWFSWSQNENCQKRTDPPEEWYNFSRASLVFLESESKLTEKDWCSSRMIQLSGALPCESFLSAATAPLKRLAVSWPHMPKCLAVSE